MESVSLISTQPDEDPTFLSGNESLLTALSSLSVDSTRTAIESDDLQLNSGDARTRSTPRRITPRRRWGKSFQQRQANPRTPVVSSVVQPAADGFRTPITFASASLRGRPNRSTPTMTPRSGVRRPRTPTSEESSPQAIFQSDEPNMETIHLSADDMTQMKPFAKDDCNTFPLYTQLKGQQLCYPLIYLSPAGSISVVLSSELIVETAVDQCIRVVSHGKFSAFVSGRGSSSSIIHPLARILHSNTSCGGSVSGRFVSSSNDKLVVIGNPGILFTMDHLREAYLVTSGHKGASSIVLDMCAGQFPRMDNDYTLLQFYRESETGSEYIPLCKELVDTAIYDRRPDGSLVMQINGMTIRHSTNGDVVVDARPRHISCTAEGNVHLRTSHIDMGVQMGETAFIKFGSKRVHVSVSGMVVSDGTSCTSMDHCGRIICAN